jgi:cation transport ATPase
MACWGPQPEDLDQIITLLKQSQSTDNQIQRNVQMVSFQLDLCVSSHILCIFFFVFFLQCNVET